MGPELELEVAQEVDRDDAMRFGVDLRIEREKDPHVLPGAVQVARERGADVAQAARIA